MERELDLKIAEWSGWVWMQRVDSESAWLFPPDSCDENANKKGLFGEPVIRRCHVVGPFEPYRGGRKNGAGDTLPAYSTDGNAMLGLVNILGQKDWAARLFTFRASSYAGVAKSHMSVDKFRGEADTLPMALALAVEKLIDCQAHD